jgi:hypothetical protein
MNTKLKLIALFALVTMSMNLPNLNAWNEVQEVEIGDSVSEAEFRNVPPDSRPWVYWWWLKGNVSEASITRDLEAMQQQGVGGVLLFDPRGYHDDYYTGNVPVQLGIKHEFMSTGWREMVKYAVREADRLGLTMSINLANTGGALRGPWDMGADGPKRLLWSAANVSGPLQISAELLKPAFKEYFWDVKLLAVQLDAKLLRDSSQGDIDLNSRWYEVVNGEKGDAAQVKQVLDLDEFVQDGRLNWQVPAGCWRIIRFACAVFAEEGHHGGTSAGAGSVDILNAGAVKKYFTKMGDTLLDDAGDLAGKVLTHFYNVSWEGTYPNWTLGFAEEFLKYHGYGIEHYLPVLTGMIVENMEVSQRFMDDYYRTVSDCFLNNSYKQIGELCHARGIKWHSENGGPWNREAPIFIQADMLSFWGSNDMPQGEFWVDRDRLHRINARFAAMAAHIYGRRLVSMEAFTHMDYHWSKYPAYLKPVADRNFADGANLFVWHTFTSSPIDVGKPGYEYFAGTHINTNITWWDKSHAFMEYLGRCQYLLQQGTYVADICVYVSDKNYVRWGRGEKWHEKASLTPEGHQYNLLNTDVLVNRLRYDDGRLVLPGGMQYDMLVIDLEDNTIPEDAMQKISDLAAAGATIVLGANKPVRATGLKNYPESDRTVLQLAERLWKGGSSAKGNVFSGTSMAEVLKHTKRLPDFEGPFEYIHRRQGDIDIYFVSGSGNAECTFRVQSKEPELWDPVDGMVREAVMYDEIVDGRTIVPIDLSQNGSVFVVFRRPRSAERIVSASGSVDGLEIIERDQAGLKLQFWQGGTVEFTMASGKTVKTVSDIQSPVTLTGSWQVKFAPDWGGPQTTTFDELMLWNEHEVDGIKYYSGSAAYFKTFQLTAEQAQGPARLQLGEVHDIARVQFNGTDLGVVWTAPWSVDVSEAVKAGENELNIEVTNCWANRLIGDAGLPAAERYTETNVRLVPDRGAFQDYESYSAKDELMPSGLLGPVRIEFGVEQRITY